jgi:hypothetical protein
MDTDGSLDEGNDIEPQSDGSFRTVGASLRYSALDQYLMGMRQASEVPPFFLVRNPTGTSRDRGRSPQTGVVFGGTRKDVTIADVQAALTARSPVGGPWVRPLRQAFVYVSVALPRTRQRSRNSRGSARRGRRSSPKRPKGEDKWTRG